VNVIHAFRLTKILPNSTFHNCNHSVYLLNKQNYSSERLIRCAVYISKNRKLGAEFRSAHCLTHSRIFGVVLQPVYAGFDSVTKS